MTSYIRNVIENPDNSEELVIDLGDDLCREAGWEVGDTLEWQDMGNGSWQITKKVVIPPVNN
jgi:hypothetical protein